MKNKKIIWIDVGTHFGQEYNSIFGSNFYFFYKIIKRFLNGNILNRQKSISLFSIKKIIQIRAKIRKKSKCFYSIFIEANPKIIFEKKFYLNADMIFNIALTSEKNKPIAITKLYLGSDGELSQSSSIFSKKKNINKDYFITTTGIFNNDFFTELRFYLNKKFNNYDIILRLNCEGVEDDIIYSVHYNFGKKLKLICGSLKDVSELKGDKAFKELNKYISSKKLLFLNFHSKIETWLDAHKAILNILKKNGNN